MALAVSADSGFRSEEEMVSPLALASKSVLDTEPQVEVAETERTAALWKPQYRRPTELDPGWLLADRWRVVRKIGQGSFGSVYEATDVEGGMPAALKVEARNSVFPVLPMEAEVLWLMADSPHAPRLFDAARLGPINYIAMELLGKSLGHLKRARPDQLLSVSTTIHVAISLFQAMEDLHGVGYLHRDLKPANLVTGREDQRRIVLLDFGLSRRYVEQEDGRVRTPRRRKLGFRGTLRYAPLASHKKSEFGRADDLVSALYTLSELGTGRLPWRDLHDKYEVQDRKEETAGAALFPYPFPSLLARIFNHVSRLDVNDAPSYRLYIRALTDVAQRRRYAHRPLDWQ